MAAVRPNFFDNVSLVTEKTVVAPNVVIYSPDAVYSVKWIKRALDAYIVLLILQYLCFFCGLPFEDISNRPGVCIVSEFFLLATAIVCIFLIPLGSSTIPDRFAYMSHVLSSVFQVLCLSLTIASTLVTYRSENFVMPITSNGVVMDVVDISMFIKVTSAATLVICIITFSLSLVNTYSYGKLFYRLLNRIDRHSKPILEYEAQTNFRSGTYISNYDADNGTQIRFPEDILKSVERSFV